MVVSAWPSFRRKARAAHESTTATEPALIGLDLRAVVGLQLIDGVAVVALQATRDLVDERVDATLATPGPEDDRPILGGLDLQSGALPPLHAIAHGLGNDDLPLAGEVGFGLHLTYMVRRRAWKIKPDAEADGP